MHEQSQSSYECAHGAQCGGCAFLAVPLTEQLAHKHVSLVRALTAYEALRMIEVKPVARAAPMLGYRTRAKLVVSAVGEIGLYARGGRVVTDIPQCRVLHPALLEVVAEVRQRSRATPGALTGIDVRLVNDPAPADGGSPPADAVGVLLTLIGAAQREPALRACAAELAQHGRVHGVAIRLQRPLAKRLLDGDLVPVAGRPVLRDHLRPGGPFHYVTFGSFVQAHAGQAAAIAAEVCGHVASAAQASERPARSALPLAGLRVLELFAGSGALGIELSTQGAAVSLVERYAPALAFAEQAAREQRLAGIDCRAGDAESVVRACVASAERFDAIVVNPPRRGLSAGLRALLPQLGARALVYVSCEPATLARDLADLACRGFRAWHAQPFDMIPLSLGVETVVCLRPDAPAPLATLYEDEHLLVVDKPPHLPTTPHPGHPLSLLERLQRERSLPELTALHRLDVGTSGVCLLAKRRASAHALSERLRAGEKHYIALVVGAVRAKGIVRAALREQGKTRPAVSRYTRISREGAHSLVRVRPEQGRTHQVRKHMAALGHPVLGDARYGDGPSNLHFEHQHGLDRTFLHAGRVVLPACGDAPAITLEAALAPDLAAVLQSTRQA